MNCQLITISLLDWIYRNRHGGGVLMYVHDSFIGKVLSVGPYNLELLSISCY